MNLKQLSTVIFLGLIAHQVEEYIYKFWVNFPLYDMPKTFFIRFNFIADLVVSILIIGIWKNKKITIPLLRMFVGLMTVNGIWHIIWAIASNSYQAGLVTGIGFLLIHSFFLYRWGQKFTTHNTIKKASCIFEVSAKFSSNKTNF